MKNYFTLLFAFIIMMATACSESLTFTQGEINIITQESPSKILPLYIIDNPHDTLVLRAIAKDFNKTDVASAYYQQLKERMLATVQDTTNPGVGLAAPQLGISKRLIVVQRFDRKGEPLRFYLNAKIEKYSEECELGPEGCLSVPGKSAEVMSQNR